MITVWNEGGYYQGGAAIPAQEGIQAGYRPETGRTKTMAYGIMAAHNLSGIPRYYLRRHHPDGPGQRPEGISAALCADELS